MLIDPSAAELERVAAVVSEYLARKAGISEPYGYGEGREWQASRIELCRCCEQYKSNPKQLRKHCCSIQHLAALHGVRNVSIVRTVLTALRRVAQKPTAQDKPAYYIAGI